MEKIINGINIDFGKKDSIVYFKYKGAAFELININECSNYMTHFWGMDGYPTFDEIITQNTSEISNLNDNWCLYFAYDFLLVEMDLSNRQGSMEDILYEITKNIDNYYNQGMNFYKFLKGKKILKRNNK